MFKTLQRILGHLESRRKWNRTRRWMRDRAYSRAMATVYLQGRMWRRI